MSNAHMGGGTRAAGQVEDVVTVRVSTEGADMLTLAGVNDANLLELSRLFGVKISLRGDAIVITGSPDFAERASAVGRRMVEIAKQGDSLNADDVLRLGSDSALAEDSAVGAGRVALPGMRKIIQAKTAGQAEYLAKIAENDLRHTQQYPLYF